MGAAINSKQQKTTVGTKVPRVRSLSSGPCSDFISFLNAMNKVDINSPASKLNETSIDDGRGGRIVLNKDSFVKK